MKTKEAKPLIYPEAESKPAVLRETASLAIGPTVSVRDAKSHLSALLDWVSGGREVTITSDGKPKARLVPAIGDSARKVFQGMGEFLRDQPVDRGPTGERLIRQDRDGRGW